MLTSLALISALAAAQASSGPVIPAFFTGERLYGICTGDDPGQCWMYVAGVLDGVFEAESAAGTRSICPARLTNREAAERVTIFLRENSEFRGRAAAVGVRAALQSNLECEGAEQADAP